ncbi:hypothetical protein Pcinc_013733 [Petrolisthes cinctipes]|uniref:Peptidase M12B domain-containing protein n=1 Tax=Petrolisthes cinctipes TaxID=88211 RepID=A0AAE1KQ17_PETCI|nr:hypothetical protein Pcinc_013733 [Petrolisthes cinctipes]
MAGVLVVSLALLSLLDAQVQAIAVDAQATLKQILLEQLTPNEKHYYFGDSDSPNFYLVRPCLTLLPSPPHPQGHAKLLITSEELNVDAVVVASGDLVGPHLTTGIYVDGELLPFQPELCHFRSSNATHVVTVNNCDGQGLLNGIIMTPKYLVTLHPVPDHLIHHIQHHSPCSCPPLCESSYGLHILHIALKDDLPAQNRRKRSFHERNYNEENDDEKPRTCATGPEHDVREFDEIKTQYRHPKALRFRNLAEITKEAKFNLAQARNQEQLREHGSDEADVGKESPVSLDEKTTEPDSHNHTVEAQPVVAVLRKIIELAVFSDEHLYSNFPQRVDSQDKSKLVNYLLTMVNAVQGIYHQEELGGFVLDLQIVRLDILTSNGPSSSGGDIGAYLSSFCSWQQRINPSQGAEGHWDHAFMLSGLDLHSSGNPSVIGLAWVGGMCRAKLSCTMNEGRSFMSVFVVAHEMGHNLGMNHDGQGDARPCSSTKYIMSPSVGPGKTTWSSCSAQVIHSFLRKSSCLDNGSGAAIILNGRTGAAIDKASAQEQRGGRNMMSRKLSTGKRTGIREVELENLLRKTPGYQFPLPKQCQTMYGRDYYPALTKFDLCNYLYCTNGVVTRPAHPALEGSFCGKHRICIAGKCRPEEDLASLLLYNLPTTDSIQVTPETSVMPATFKPSTMASTDPSTTFIEVTTDNNENPDGSSNKPPTLSGLEPDDCSCTLDSSSSPDVLANVPREICPFVAPVYHHLFGCSAECSHYDLHLDLNSGNLTWVLSESSALEEAIDSCFIGSYTVVSDFNSKRTDAISSDIQDHVINTLAVSDDIRAPLKDPVACQGIPQFLHPALHCPKSDSISQDNCPPAKIILKTLEHNLTYTLESSSGSIADEITLKGQYYTLSRSRNLNFNRNLDSHIVSAPLTGGTNEESHFGYIKCDLEASFPDVLRDIPKEVCPFLAPSLHKLFNCSMNSECEQFVAIVDQEDHNVKEIPVPISNVQQQVQHCPHCQQQQLNVSTLTSTISAIIEVFKVIIAESDFLCKLLPFDWTPLVFGCNALGVIENPSKNECPPVSVIIHSSHTTFTYTSDMQNNSQPTINWQGNTFSLESINVGKSPADVLQDKYGIDITSHMLRRKISEETVGMQYTNKKKSYRGNKMAEQPLEWKRPLTMIPGHIPDSTSEPLQEYMGQNDVFLPLNAPEAMPRTKVGPCSVTCGEGTRSVQLECIDVKTEEVLNDNACQGYTITKQELEPCRMPSCRYPRWKVSNWGSCSESCGIGVQYRSVQCVMEINRDSESGEIRSDGFNSDLAVDPSLVVDDDQCKEEMPANVQGCQGPCTPDDYTAAEIEISKDFDY